MPNTPFSTTRTWVVARGQHVRLEFDLLDGKERPVRMPGTNLKQLSTLVWLDNKTALYLAEGNELLNGDSFQLFLGMGDWKQESGVKLNSLPGLKYDQIRIIVNDDYKQSPEQQIREAQIPGAVAGLDPRIEGARTRAQALLDYLR